MVADGFHAALDGALWTVGALLAIVALTAPAWVLWHTAKLIAGPAQQRTMRRRLRRWTP